MTLSTIPEVGRCKQCGKLVGPLFTKDGKRPRRGFDMTHIDPQGLFCTMRCAAKFGVTSAKAKGGAS